MAKNKFCDFKGAYSDSKPQPPTLFKHTKSLVLSTAVTLDTGVTLDKFQIEEVYFINIGFHNGIILL